MIHLILFLIATTVSQDVERISIDLRTITGTVVADTNEPLIFCNIVAYDKDLRILNAVTTDLEGKFTITVSTSCQWIEAAYTGMQTTRMEVGEANHYLISLKPGVMLETVVIAYKTSLVEYDISTSGGVELIRNLPTKNINKLAATTAGLSSIDGGEISIRGSRTHATDYYLDGIRVSSAESKKSIKSKSTTSAESVSATAHHDEIDHTYSSGQLTAGEINDFGKWILWNDKTQQELTDYRNVWNIYPLERYMVIVQNAEGIPIIGQTIYLVDNNSNIIWTAKTDNTGKAELWSNMFEETHKDSLTYSIISKRNDQEYSIPNAKRFENGVNHMTIQSDCNLSNVVDAVFVVDATSSMSDEINYLKEELTDVMRKVKESNEDLVLNLGSVFYRDHGDEYVTRTSELSSDISKTIDFIHSQTAAGGGDQPEAIDEALEMAVRHLNWSSDARTKLLFIVMDASPHNGPENLNRLREITYEAAKEGIRIIPLTASGINKDTEYLMRSLALCTNGTYVFLTDHSGIGNTHLSPTTDAYDVEKLNDLIIRLFDQYTAAESCSQDFEQNSQVVADTTEIQSRQRLVVDTFPGHKTDGMKKEIAKITCTYYPNPTTGIVNIEVKGTLQELFLVDISGKLLQRFELNGEDRIKIDISQYPMGTYRLTYFESSNVPQSGMVVLAK